MLQNSYCKLLHSSFWPHYQALAISLICFIKLYITWEMAALKQNPSYPEWNKVSPQKEGNVQVFFHAKDKKARSELLIEVIKQNKKRGLHFCKSFELHYRRSICLAMLLG